MRTANINIMSAALDKISHILLRDFGEIEYLQNNQNAAVRFTNSTYQRVEEKLVQELIKKKQDCDVINIHNKAAFDNLKNNSFFVICPIDGLINYSRSISDYSSFIAFGKINEEGIKDIKELVILEPNSNRYYSAIKNAGAFNSNKKNKIFKIGKNPNQITAIDNIKFANLAQDDLIKISNCHSLDIVKLSMGQIDKVIFDKKNINLIEIIKLLPIESGLQIDLNKELIKIY